MRYAGIFALQAFPTKEVHKPIIKDTLDIAQGCYPGIIEVNNFSFIGFCALVGRKFIWVLRYRFF